MPTRAPELRPYRVAVYAVFALLGVLVSGVVLRSVIGDLFGRQPPGAAQRPATASACADDVERLLSAILARAAQPLTSDASLEWDVWSRRWEDDLASVAARCRLDDHLDTALDGLESLRRALDRGGQETSRDARTVRQELAAARESLKPRR